MERKPEGSGDTLRLELALRGNTGTVMGADGETVKFMSPGGARVLRYGGLKAWDASGRELACRLGVEGGEKNTARVVLDIGAAGAVFPLTIDPLSESALWTVDGPQASARLGNSVASAGDVNGDGYSDIVAGAPFDLEGGSQKGRGSDRVPPGRIPARREPCSLS